MNIKSLLLGSAAALVAVTGARAADAVVVAEPEPMDYVRICDTYGAGFYYIPGTETCLKVSGYFRYDIGVGDAWGLTSYDKKDWYDNGEYDENDTYYKRARFQLRVDARSETELGTLRAYAALNFQWDTKQGYDDVGPYVYADNAWAVEHAYLELGGLRIGKTDSLFSTFTNYAGGVIHDDMVPYGPFDTHQIAYTFTGGNGFTAAVALEEGDSAVYTLDSYVPHVVAGIGFTQGWGGVSAVVGYDSVWEEVAGKVRLDVNITDTISAFVMGGWKSDSDVRSYYGTWGGAWGVWGGFSAGVTDKAVINVQLSYDDYENFAAVGNVAYELVPGLKITPEIGYYDNFDYDNADAFGGYLRFQRNF
ncbi:MAG: porin [Rhizobiaceae bacterium]|nr:porin [Rhizobiaceae bacterium]